MAKELPYFKFEPAEYLTKNISFCSLSAQGLFVNVCSYYWQRNCKLTKEQVLRRLNYETELNELIAEGIIDLKDEFIVIKFLDNQLKEVEEKSKTNSKNGKLGGRPKKPKESEQKPNALNSLSETKGIREDNIKEDNKREYKIKLEKDKIYLEQVCMNKKIKLNLIQKYIDDFDLGYANENYFNYSEYKKHFFRWINLQDNTKFETKKYTPTF